MLDGWWRGPLGCKQAAAGRRVGGMGGGMGGAEGCTHKSGGEGGGGGVGGGVGLCASGICVQYRSMYGIHLHNINIIHTKDHLYTHSTWEWW